MPSIGFGAKLTRGKKVHRDLGQGVRTFHEDPFAEVDILAVPGLGTNPEECWTWSAATKNGTKPSNLSTDTDSAEAASSAYKTRDQHNWIRDPDGLASLFPRSRIMLYDYASAWTGALKVRATMKSICTVLLDDLQEKRKGGAESTRPLIMIGHSMGGVVIAKALCMARARKEHEALITCTMGCAFFGVPFKGTEMAKIALLYSSMFGNEAYEALLEFMRAENNNTLDEVREDFVDLCTKLNPPIEVFCAWEQVPSDVSYSSRVTQRLPGWFQHKYLETGARALTDATLWALGGGTFFVSEESAQLDIAHVVGLTADHRGLIQFESVTSEKFTPVKEALNKMVQTAGMNARKRNFSSSQSLLTQRFVNQVRHALEGVDMKSKYRTSIAHRAVASWLTSEPSFQDWLTDRIEINTRSSYLWLRGGPGFGKTNAALAAIQKLVQAQAEEQTDENRSRASAFLAYFLCERAPGCCTAEDVLKSIIVQLVNQEETLAQHAKWLVSSRRHRHAVTLDDNTFGDGDAGISGAQATATVDNLWKYLLDMLDDPVVDSVHVVISNLHCLETTESTRAFLSRLRENADFLGSRPPGDRRPKWLITSRNEKQICSRFDGGRVSIIDLEDGEYGGKLKAARQHYARDAVARLRARKGYNAELVHNIRNSIGSRSDEKWIDVLCLLLQEKPNTSSNLSIRQWLKKVGERNTHQLVEYAWQDVLSRNEDVRLEIEELLQVMTIVFESPTLAELAALTDTDDHQRVADLVKRCSPIFRFGEVGDERGKILFTNMEFKDQLTDVAHGHEDQQKRQYHGTMAHRCFTYIKSTYGSGNSPTLDMGTLPHRSSTITRRAAEDPDVVLVTDKDDELEGALTSSSQTLSHGCSYPVKYLIKHLGEGYPDVAHDLCDDDPEFWGQKSSLRDAWLQDFRRFKSELKNLNTTGMSALHVAAGIGATELVSILVSRSRALALTWTNDEGMTALHVAALNNHSDVVDVLIKAGADVEAGEGRAGTALHLAALHGQCSTIRLLIGHGANVNAFSQEHGPIINAAILSGTVDAVSYVMHGDVRFDLDYEKCDPPLSLSAERSEPSLFKAILETGKQKWLQNAKLLDQALVASSAGRLESVRTLLRFEHVYTTNTLQKAVYSAAVEKKWSSVSELLDYVTGNIAHGMRRDLSLSDVFYLAAVSRDAQLDVLKKIWRFTNNSIPHDVLDFSLYHATILKKLSTVNWLLDACNASANATSQRPPSMLSDPATVVPSRDYRNALNAAAGLGHPALVLSLLERGAEADNEQGGVALQLAASEGFADVVDILLSRGAMINKTIADSPELSLSGGTALQAACDNGRLSVVQTLVKQGADPNLGHRSTCPIIAATKRSDLDIIEILLDIPEINVNVTEGGSQSTPLIYAATNMPAAAVGLLVSRGAEVNVQNASGDTALVMAAWKGDQACVELLCNAGADVTYQSPRRGLPIQVAANEHHPECAHILAERMGGTIAEYRENAPRALATLRERDNEIETLNSLIAETNEQLDIARKDVDNLKYENERVRSDSSLYAETYESIGQQLKAMQTERVELVKQLDAAKGHLGLANDTARRLREDLDDERKKNELLRKRHGYVALQEEKKAALEQLEQVKREASEQSELDQHNKDKLIGEVDFLLGRARELEALSETAQQATEMAVRRTEMEKIGKEKAQEEVRVLQATVQQMEGVLASVQEAASRSKSRPLESPPATEEVTNPMVIHSVTHTEDHTIDHPVDHTVFTNGTAPQRALAHRSQSDTLVVGVAGVDATNGTNGNHIVSGTAPAGQFHAAADRMKRRQTDGLIQTTASLASPSAGTTSPASPAPGGFRTIHGHHRMDGSLGGYRANRVQRKPISNSLYSVSIHGDRRLSKESIGRESGSASSSTNT